MVVSCLPIFVPKTCIYMCVYICMYVRCTTATATTPLKRVECIYDTSILLRIFPSLPFPSSSFFLPFFLLTPQTFAVVSWNNKKNKIKRLRKTSFFFSSCTWSMYIRTIYIYIYILLALRGFFPFPLLQPKSKHLLSEEEEEKSPNQDECIRCALIIYSQRDEISLALHTISQLPLLPFFQHKNVNVRVASRRATRHHHYLHQHLHQQQHQRW